MIKNFFNGKLLSVWITEIVPSKIYVELILNRNRKLIEHYWI